MNDFECQINHASHCTESTRSLSSTYTPSSYLFVIPNHISSAHISFLANISTVQEPSNYKEAKGDARWVEAMKKEIEALEKNDTWEIVDFPVGKRPIGCKWVFKVKLKADGTIDRYKSRLVAKGYHQIEGIDFQDSFSPVVKVVTVRIFLFIAGAHSWPLHQLDINNAFLHGHLDEEVYMETPEGYEKAQKGQVYRMKRSLCGLKQASRQRNFELTSQLKEYGFIQSIHDHCLFILSTTNLFPGITCVRGWHTTHG